MKNVSPKKTWQAFVSDLDVYKSLERFALSQCISASVVKRCSMIDALYLINEKSDVYFLEYDPSVDLETIYRLFAQRAHEKGSKVVLLSTKENMPDFNWLVSVGVDSVENIPVDTDKLDRLLISLFKYKSSNLSYSSKILSFVELKANNGTMTCALNVASILSRKHKTLIIDFDIYCSHTSVFFDFEKDKHLVDLLENADRIDRSLVLSSVKNINSNLHILSSTLELTESFACSKIAVDKLIVSCSEIYDYIVIYLPFNPVVYQHPSLILSTCIICVVNLDQVNKQTITRMLPLLAKSNKNIYVAVNHLSKTYDLSLEDFFVDLTIQHSGEISFHESLMAEAREKKTLATDLDPSSKFNRELTALLHNIGVVNKSAESLFLQRAQRFLRELIGIENDKKL